MDDGWLLTQDDTGNIYNDIRGNGTYENLYLRSSNGTNTDTCITVDTNRAVHLNYQGATKLSTISSGINVTGSVTCDGLTCDGDALVTSSTGILTVRDSDNSGNATNCYVQGQNLNGANRWRIGQNSTGNEALLALIHI